MANINSGKQVKCYNSYTKLPALKFERRLPFFNLQDNFLWILIGIRDKNYATGHKLLNNIVICHCLYPLMDILDQSI